MQNNPSPSPFAWLQSWAWNMGWPVVVMAAFWLGRYVQRLETRVHKTEQNIKTLLERHMPAIHNTLAEIRGLLTRGR